MQSRIVKVFFSVKTALVNAPLHVVLLWSLAIPCLIKYVFFNSFELLIREISIAITGEGSYIMLVGYSLSLLIIIAAVFTTVLYLNDNSKDIIPAASENHPNLIPIFLPHDIELYYQLNNNVDEEDEVTEEDELVLEDNALNELIGYVPELGSKMQEFKSKYTDHETIQLEKEIQESQQEMVNRIANSLRAGPLNEGMPITEVTTLSEILTELENNQNQ